MRYTTITLAASLNRNSRGGLIHNSDKGISNFWQWFGSSKIVNSKGEPIVGYHGANGDFDTFELGWRKAIWVADTVDHAEQFTISQFNSDDSVEYYHKGNIMPVYMKIEKPAYYNFQKMVDPNVENEEIKRAISSGHDGIVFTDSRNNRKYYVVFTPSQLKSVSGNNGNFDPKKDSITASSTRRVR